jgi:ABC-type methionine transport system ATPase subunit
MAKAKVKLIYPPELVDKPIIWSLIREFSFIVNIRKAEVKEELAWLEVDLEGQREEIARGIEWLKSKGLKVEILEEGAK